MGPSAQVTFGAFSHDRALSYAVSNGEVRGAVRARLVRTGHTAGPTHAFSHDGALVFVAGAEDSNGSTFCVRAAPLEGEQQRWRYAARAPLPHAMNLDPSGEVLLFSYTSKRGSGALDAHTGAPLPGNAPPWAGAPALQEDQRVFATERDCAWAFFEGALWALGARAARRSAPPDEHTFATEPFRASPDGSLFVTGSRAGDALVWSVTRQDGALPAARVVGRVRLARAADGPALAEFDRLGKTLLLATQRGVLVVCSIAP